MPQFTLIGGGGHATSLLHMLPEGMVAVGYTDLRENPTMPLPWLGADDAAAAGPLHIALALGTDDSLRARRSMIDRLQGREFVTLVAPSAIVSDSRIGAGSAVMHGAILNGCTLGEHCIVNTGAIVEHGVVLGQNCFVGPGAVICGGTEVGRDCCIGAGATLRNGCNICNSVTIGMGAVVVSDISEPGIYVGNPARKLP